MAIRDRKVQYGFREPAMEKKSKGDARDARPRKKLNSSGSDHYAETKRALIGGTRPYEHPRLQGTRLLDHEGEVNLLSASGRAVVPVG